jgi:hypothetical protein
MAVRDPKTEALRDEIDRRMSGGEKIELAMQMREEALNMARDSIRRQQPDISEDDLEFEVRKRCLGKELAELSEPARREYLRRQRAERDGQQSE